VLAQWVPLHAVSCSNLIETGVGAESREIPLRVTQTDCLLARLLACSLARACGCGAALLFSSPLLSAARNLHPVARQPSEGDGAARPLLVNAARARFSAYSPK